MSRKIEIHRLFTLHNLAQDDPEVKAWFGMSHRAIGPCWDVRSKSNVTGLSFEEEKAIMPSILKIEADDRGFRQAVTNYFDSIVTPVPQRGVVLEIGLANDNQPISTSNLPLKPKDFVAYRHAIAHRDVALNKEDGESTFGKAFYIHDPKGTSESAIKLSELEDKATALYFKYKGDIVKVDQILVMLGIQINKLTHAEKVLKFKELSQRGSGIESEQTDRLNNFIEICTDKDLEYKYLITEMIGAKFLKKVGTNILLAESGEKVGDNMEDAVLYYKNPKNSSETNILKARYETLVKKGVDYLPKDAE